MTKVLLAMAPYPRSVKPYWPPVGISYVASYLLARDPRTTVKAVDYTLEEFSPESWRDKLAQTRPDIVGISLLTMNAANAVMLARLTKEVNPNIVTVLGGVHASLYPEELAQDCDVVVRGEGEETFYEIAQGRELGKINGITYMRNGKVFDTPPRSRIVNLDALPFPAISLFNVNQYIWPRSGSGAVTGSRGCPFGCTFCASQNHWGRIIRLRSAKNIVDEVARLHQEYGFRRIEFQDDLMNLPQKRAFEICDEIIGRGLHKKLEFFTLIRGNRNLVSRELFAQMREANFRDIGMGIESGSPKVLKTIRKSITVQEASQTIKMAKQAGIKIGGNFMVGNWDETIWDIFKTWRFVLRNNVIPAFWICTPYPGTEFARQLTAAGYLKAGQDWWARANAYTAITRTNRMGKRTITFVYFVSVMLQIVLTSIRTKRLGAGFSLAHHAVTELRGNLKSNQRRLHK